jgi:Fe/S biogenesis protein NfuA
MGWMSRFHSDDGSVLAMTSSPVSPFAAQTTDADPTDKMVVDEMVIDEMVISVTEVAREKISELRDAEPEGKRLGLRLEILSEDGDEFTYDLSFQELVEADISDLVKSHGGLRIIIPVKDATNLEGATLDYEHDGLVLRNPNKPRPISLGNLTSGDALSQEIRAVIEAEINPALDAHGGFVTFVGHDGDGRAFLTMGGGCHGCSMSRQTMLQGVQTTIKERIPAISKVIDATDHSTGDTPYYN